MGATVMPRLKRMGTDGIPVPDSVREYGQQKELRLHRDGPRSAVRDEAMTSAYVTGAVNGILLGRDRYLAPRQ
ncbi:hypothetical protein [Streptomyces sp. SCSIO 30461]|uniref:hypothetical protein n=1 Tax=Streptomyces sp. SCSIO 30461 TaxID=3118085 RepID=UPI00387E9EC9